MEEKKNTLDVKRLLLVLMVKMGHILPSIYYRDDVHGIIRRNSVSESQQSRLSDETRKFKHILW
jgi:hypothetical protein